MLNLPQAEALGNHAKVSKLLRNPHWTGLSGNILIVVTSHQDALVASINRRFARRPQPDLAHPHPPQRLQRTANSMA
jgi:hypothetical protein